MPKTSDSHHAGTVRLRTPGWTREATRYGLVGDTAIAAHMGMPANTYYRVRTGRVEPSMKFVKSALWAFPLARYEELFEAVTETGKGVAA